MPTLKNKKHERFCREYYVYFLVDPRSNEIFYVGKGKGNRMYQHKPFVDNAVNSIKVKRLEDIVTAGEEVFRMVFKRFRSESKAFACESQLIKYLPNLTNIAKGQESPLKNHIAKIQDSIDRIVPLDRWIRKVSPSQEDIDFYHRVVSQYNYLLKNAYQRLNTEMV